MTRAEVGARKRRAEVLAETLEEISTRDARSIRMAVLRVVHEASQGDYALFHDVVSVDGQATVSEVLTHGPCDAAGLEKALRELNAGKIQVVERAKILSTFSSPRHVFPTREDFEASPTYRMFRQFGTHDIAGLVVLHARTLLGAVSASLGAPRLFSEQDRVILQPLVKPVKGALIAAHCFLQEGMPDEIAYLLVRPDGRFDYASATASVWLKRTSLMDAVRRRVRLIDRGRALKESPALEQAEARVVRLRTDGSTRYLVCLRRSPLVQRPGAPLLTPMQLRVALAAVDGATGPEIARDLGRSVETVREHLAAVYRKLGVTRRVELARAMRDHGRT